MEDDLDFLGDFARRMDEARKEAQKTERRFERAALDPLAVLPELGDTVVVNAGLVGRGFEWKRLEATVIAVGQSSYKVEYTDYRGLGNEPVREWLHPSVITDVVRKAQKQERSE